MDPRLERWIDCFCNKHITFDELYYCNKLKKMKSLKSVGTASLFIPVGGSLIINTHNGKEECGPSQIALWNLSNQVRDINLEGNGYVVFFSMDGKENADLKPLLCDISSEVMMIIRRICKGMNINRPYDDDDKLKILKANQQVYKMCYYLFESSSLKGDTDETLLCNAVSYIHANVHKPLTVDNLADFVGMDKKRFSYLFNKKYALSPKKYLTEIKLEKAKEFLVYDQYCICEISRAVGYEDVFGFSRIFKKYTGFAPSHYREKYIKKK